MYAVWFGDSAWRYEKFEGIVEHIVDHVVPFDANDDDDVLLYMLEEHPHATLSLEAARTALREHQNEIAADVKELKARVDRGERLRYKHWIITRAGG